MYNRIGSKARFRLRRDSFGYTCQNSWKFFIAVFDTDRVQHSRKVFHMFLTFRPENFSRHLSFPTLSVHKKSPKKFTLLSERFDSTFQPQHCQKINCVHPFVRQMNQLVIQNDFGSDTKDACLQATTQGRRSPSADRRRSLVGRATGRGGERELSRSSRVLSDRRVWRYKREISMQTQPRVSSRCEERGAEPGGARVASLAHTCAPSGWRTRIGRSLMRERQVYELGAGGARIAGPVSSTGSRGGGYGRQDDARLFLSVSARAAGELCTAAPPVRLRVHTVVLQ